MQRSQTVDESNNPIFDHEFCFPALSSGETFEMFHVRIFDEDEFGEPELLGHTTIPFSTFPDLCRSNTRARSPPKRPT